MSGVHACIFLVRRRKYFLETSKYFVEGSISTMEGSIPGMQGLILRVRGSTGVLNDSMDFARGSGNEGDASSPRAPRNKPQMMPSFVEEKRCEHRCCDPRYNRDSAVLQRNPRVVAYRRHRRSS